MLLTAAVITYTVVTLVLEYCVGQSVDQIRLYMAGVLVTTPTLLALVSVASRKVVKRQLVTTTMSKQ